MREIKFRAWDKKHLSDTEYEMYGPFKLRHINVNGFYHVNIESIIMQYTGLKDKNGVEIYEGDIIKGSWSKILEVYYDKDYLQFRVHHKLRDNVYSSREIDYYGIDKIEIIGNIYQNPNLLTK